MSNVLRFSILFGVLSAVLCHNVRDDVPWFKERERITDQFLVGMVNGRNTACNGTGTEGQARGVCLPARECITLGGIKGGPCSFLGSCCIIEKTCGSQTSSKLSYFVSPKVFQSDCSLTIKPINKDVCQIRLDFESFSIAQPTQPDDQNRSYQCYHDAFTVTSSGPAGYLGFEHICGENKNQHIYVPVNNQTNVVLRFQLHPNRNNVTFLGSLPYWRIRIRQLECWRQQYSEMNNVHSSLAAMHNLHHHRKPPRRDNYWIAPNGCLQYYPERTGYYESFNFNMGHGPYIGKTKYAICFRRTPDACGIRHTADFFVLNFNLDIQANRTEIVCHTSEPAGPDTSQDSLQIPGGILHDQYLEYFCDEQLNNTVTSSVPGPLFVVVRADGYCARQRVEIGFRMQYQLQSTECHST